MRRAKLIELKAKSIRREVVLPVISSKLFEIGPLRPLKTERYLMHTRNKLNPKNTIPEAYRSLDLRQTDEKKLVCSLHQRLNLKE